MECMECVDYHAQSVEVGRSGSGLEPGFDALQTTAFTTEPMGLWQLWTSNLALILLTVAVSVDYSGIATMAMP